MLEGTPWGAAPAHTHRPTQLAPVLPLGDGVEGLTTACAALLLLVAPGLSGPSPGLELREASVQGQLGEHAGRARTEQHAEGNEAGVSSPQPWPCPAVTITHVEGLSGSGTLPGPTRPTRRPVTTWWFCTDSAQSPRWANGLPSGPGGEGVSMPGVACSVALRLRGCPGPL